MSLPLPTLALAALAVGLSTTGAEAYIGPGAGMGAMATVLALVAAVLLGIVGFVWYPVKRMRARMRAGRADGGGPEAP